MNKPIKLTEAERESKIEFCLAVGSELGIQPDGDGLRALSDEQLLKRADWFWELTWK